MSSTEPPFLYTANDMMFRTAYNNWPTKIDQYQSMTRTPLLNGKRRTNTTMFDDQQTDHISLNDHVKKYFEENCTNSLVSYQEFSPRNSTAFNTRIKDL